MLQRCALRHWLQMLQAALQVTTSASLLQNVESIFAKLLPVSGGECRYECWYEAEAGAAPRGSHREEEQ